jgi:alpha-galactosidase
MIRSALWLCLVSLSLGAMTTNAREPEPKKLQVFILAGQSNMVGHANVITIPRLAASDQPEVQELASLVFKEGKTISTEMAKEQIALRIERDQLRGNLRKKTLEGEDAIAAAMTRLEELETQLEAKTKEIESCFAVSEQVYITSIADNNRRSGPLTVGFGASAEKIGPEFGFGMSLAKRIDAPILLIKTSWGGKSLHYNFRPPSAGPYELSQKEREAENAESIRENAGQNYRMMVEKVHEVLGNLKEHHPSYNAEAGHELAGFVWFQGFNDQFAPEFRDNYKDNMIAFIKDVRQEFESPKLPFVIGVLGTGITEEEVGRNAVSLAQRAAAETPEFAGNVVAVESYTLYDLEALEVFKSGWQDHFAEWCLVGSDRPYHYLGSGKFFVRFGDALADAMAGLIEQQ